MIYNTVSPNYLDITTTQSTSVVDIPFAFYGEHDIDVYVGDNLTPKVLGVDYTVIGAPTETVQARGSIRFTVEVPTNTRIFIIRNTDEVRLTDFEKAAYFEEKLLDSEFNNILRMVQDSKMYLTTAAHIHPMDIGKIDTQLPTAFANGIISVNPENSKLIFIDMKDHPDFVEMFATLRKEIADVEYRLDTRITQVDGKQTSWNEAQDNRLTALETSITSDSRYIHWNYTAKGGETKIKLPYKFTMISEVFMNGVRQTYKKAFEYSTIDYSISFAEALDADDDVVVSLGIEPQDAAGNEFNGSVPMPEPRQYGDGVTTRFKAPHTAPADANAFFVYIDGVKQSAEAGDYSVPAVLSLDFSKAPPVGAAIDITYFRPMSNSLYSIVALSSLGIKERDKEETPKIVAAFMEYDEVIVDGEYWVKNNNNGGVVPKEARVSKITFVKDSILRLDELSFYFMLENKDLVIDLRQGGTIHGGRRGCWLTRDHSYGEKVLDVNDASDLRVGDHLSTSMAFEASDVAVNGMKWNNSTRNPGDAFNTITAIDYQNNKVTVTYGVPDCRFPRNTYLQNNVFGRDGMHFEGSGNVYILGGKWKETASGYYLTGLTPIGAGTPPLNIRVDGTDFSGQGLDGFLLRGEYVNLTMENFSIYGSYDNAKQSFVMDTGGDIVLRNGKVHRGNFDVECYPTGNKITLGRMIMENVDWDGSNTLKVSPKQQWEDGSGTLDNTWLNIGDSVHITQWGSNQGRTQIAGFEAINCNFRNYRRAVVGTTFLKTKHDVSVTGSIKMTNCSMDCSPHYFNAGEGTTLYIAKDIEYTNLDINILYPDVYYILGHITKTGTGVATRQKILWNGRTKVSYTPETTPNQSAIMDGIFDEIYFKGNSAGTCTPVILNGRPIVNRIIADNITVNKKEDGQGNYLTETISFGTHGKFVGFPWRNKVLPNWTTTNFVMVNQDGNAYAGMATKTVYRTSANVNQWIPLCKLTPISAENASAQVDFATAHTYGGSGKVCGSFYVTLPTNGTPITCSEQPVPVNGVIRISSNDDKVYPITPIFMENTGVPQDLSAFQFRLYQGVLQCKVAGTTDLGMFVTIRGNVVGGV